MDAGDHVPVDFISQFHNLEGDLIGQRKKHFFKLILNPSSLPTDEQVDYVLEHLRPKTYLESLFRIDILIHFKKTAELVQVLRQDNEIFISKILKQLWFFQEAFRDVEAKQLVNEFLPTLSYAVRMKVVKQISKCWNETQIDALFDCLSERYGIFTAKIILHKCSPVKFKEVLQENDIRLHTAQVKYIFDKDIHLFEFYLDYSNSLDNTTYQESKVLNHIALKNPAFLLKLEKDKKVCFSVLGRRTSKRIMKLVKDDVLKDHTRYFKILNKSVIVRKLGGEFGKVYQQVFPKKKTECFLRYSTHMGLLLLYPKRLRWDLFRETYLKKFPGNIEGMLSVADTSLLRLNPGREIVKKWADINYNSDKGDDFLKYFNPSEAIPIIKEKINVTSDIDKRASLIMLLLQNCATNNDLNALEEVLKYICFRHRNENQNFRQSLMRQVSSDFKLVDLNENHWKYINEQLKIDRLRKEFRFWANSTLLEKHLEFLFKNGKSHKDALVEYINDVVDSNSAFLMNLDNPPIEKQILTEICKLLPGVAKSENFNSAVKNTIEKVVDFSMKHPEHCIKLADCPALVSAIQICFSKNENFDMLDGVVIGKVFLYNLNFPEYSFPVDDSRVLALFAAVSKDRGVACFREVFKKNVLRKNRSKIADEILNSYLQNLSGDSLEHYIIKWLLTNEPSRLVPHFDEVIKIGASALNCGQLKLYSHLEFDKKASAFYKKQLDEEDRCEKLIMESLVVLLSTDEFVSLANMFLPKKVKLDLEDDEMQKVYKLQCELAKVLHKVQQPTKILLVVMKFCEGDYLQSTLPALYSVLYRVPEQTVPPCVDLLAKGAVSVRKHAVFLTCEVLDRERVLNLLKNAERTNVSDQKHLFSATFNYFRRNPSRELLDAVIAGLETVDRNDTEAIERIVSCAKVPRKYLGAYVEKCWGWLERLGADKGPQIQGYMGTLLNGASVEVLKSFSSDFVRGLLTRYFGSDSLSMGVVVKILEHRVSERRENFASVFAKLPELDRTGSGAFFDCFMAGRGQSDDREFVDAFVKHWNERFAGLDMFRERIALELFLIELDRRSSEEHARKVVSLLEELVGRFGFHVFDIFREQLETALERLQDVARYSLYSDVLKHKCDASTCVLVMKLMERVGDDDDRSEVLKLFKEVMEILRNVDAPIVQIYFKSY